MKNQQCIHFIKKILPSLCVFMGVFLLSSCVHYDSNERTYTAANAVIFTKNNNANIATYFITPQESKITVKVYRTGRLASLGHDHVITINTFDGVVYLHKNLPQSTIKLVFPVSRLIIDEPSERIKAGKQFLKPISAKDIQATRNNLLGAQLLMADQYPNISLIVKKITGTLPTLLLETQIKVRDQQSTQFISAQVTLSEQKIMVSGHFTLKQTELGLTPFTIFGGAIAVADKMDVNFVLVANKAEN